MSAESGDRQPPGMVGGITLERDTSRDQPNEPDEPDDDEGEPLQVTVTDVDMPFMSMVSFMVKWALASIPALIILLVVFMVVGGALGGVLRSVR